MAQMVEYKSDNVLTAARKRVSEMFDLFGRVVVSVSSGKDSTVLYHLTMDEARRRGRDVEVFFLDQEAEYESSISMIEGMMHGAHVIPMWYQVPIMMTNATSHGQYFLDAWFDGAEWMRDKHPTAIHSTDGSHPMRFYKFFEWLEMQSERETAFLVGLRSKESLSRFRSVTNNPGVDGISWSTRTKSPKSFRFYPIYDWTFGDVWKFIVDEGVPYNPIYDKMFMKSGTNISKMRISNLIHEKSFRALADLQEFEPQTYEKLLKRLKGVHAAALYAKDEHIFDPTSLPPRFTSWREYRDYLLDTTPIDKVDRFRKRFEKQGDDDLICRQHVKQILLNDWENSIPVRATNRDKLRKVWWSRL